MCLASISLRHTVMNTNTEVAIEFCEPNNKSRDPESDFVNSIAKESARIAGVSGPISCFHGWGVRCMCAWVQQTIFDDP